MTSLRSRVSVASAARFLASGGFNTLVTYLAYLALLQWLPYQQSYSIAFASGIALAYLLNRYYVFRRPGGTLGPVYVAAIYTGQYLLGLAIVSAWVGWLGASAKLAPLVAIAISLPLTYLCNATVFAARPQAAGPGGSPVPDAWIWRGAQAALVGLPVLSVAIAALAWLRYGLDLPFYDDWRSYATGQIDSLELRHLFLGLNDTMAPVGFALDAIAQRTLAGNSIAYQLLSMLTVLGLLLLLQWKLLKAALGSPVQAAACFVFTLFMLQPGSYWGRENLAYHQALPLVFLLGALWLIAVSGGNNRWRLPAIFGLGLLAGFTYVSGAFGALAAAIGVAAVAFLALLAPRRPRIVHGALALGTAGAIASITQFVIGVLPTMGAAHRGDARLALPNEPEFWLFLLGKIGRSLLLPDNRAPVSLAVVVLAVAGAALLAVLLLRRLRADPDGPYLRVAVVYAGLVAMVFAYLLLVAAGRTHLHGPEVKSALDLFNLGFSRFHFFWAALLWPWVAATAVVLVRGRQPALAPRAILASWFLCGAAIFLMVSGGALKHFERHSIEASFREPTVSCLMAQLQRGEGIVCPEFNTADLTPAYIYGSRIGASFVRHFPVLPIEPGIDDPAPWFRFSRDRARANAVDMTVTATGYMAGADPQLLIKVGLPDEMQNCVMLDVTAVVAPSQADTMQLFFRPYGQAAFREANARAMPVEPGLVPTVVRFRLESETGFEDTLRLDPVSRPQPFALPDVEVRCRLRYSRGPFFELAQPPVAPQVIASAWLDPRPGSPNGYRAGSDAYVTFRTSRAQQMADCSVLDVDARLAVMRPTQAQVYFLARGKQAFTEQASVRLVVNPVPDGQGLPLVFRLESPSGFEDRLRLDPVDSAQDISLSEVKVSCHRRVPPGATAVPAPAPEKPARS